MRTDEFYDVEGLAELIGKPKSYIYNLRSRGEGPPAIRVGGDAKYGHLLFARADVDKWLESRKESAGAGPNP